MEFFKSNYNIVSTLVFVVFIILAQIFAINNYDWTRNTISDLGAQGYSRSLIMRCGFLAFGLALSCGILINGISWRTAPIVIYALCVALTGIFCTKPFVGHISHSVMHAALHSWFAQIAGIAFSIGIFIQLFFTPDIRMKYIHFIFFVLVIGVSITFGLVKTQQGIIQRFLYLLSFIWLVKFYKP
jgi:hypothetical membrane protein